MSTVQPAGGVQATGFSRMLLAMYGLLTVATLSVVLWFCHGSFTYALDDPYIHLALAQRLLHGSYTINFGESASPASSILWPYLLVPFSTSAVRIWIPLVYNIVAGAGCCFLLGRFFDRWNVLVRKDGESPFLYRLTAAFFIVLALNLIGLSFIGMEHTLQFLLAIACAYGVMEAYAGRPIPNFVLVAAALAPVIRYEDLAFTLAISLICWFQQRRASAIAIFILGAAPLVLFGLYLRSKGLPFLPTSVLVKGATATATTNMNRSMTSNIMQIIKGNLGSLIHRGRFLISLAILAAAYFRVRHDSTKQNAILAGTAAIVLLLLLGPQGWFYRYDAAVSGFCLLLCMTLIAQWRRTAWILILPIIWCVTYAEVVGRVPYAARSVYLQQMQMHRFEEMFYHKPVAVNDLGCVAFDHDPNIYILDLVGLGSFETATHDKTAAFLRSVTQEHNVKLLMIYTRWYPDIPKEWIVAGHIRNLLIAHRTTAETTVDVVATTPEEAEIVREKLEQFSRVVPEGVRIEIVR